MTRARRGLWGGGWSSVFCSRFRSPLRQHRDRDLAALFPTTPHPLVCRFLQAAVGAWAGPRVFPTHLTQLAHPIPPTVRPPPGDPPLHRIGSILLSLPLSTRKIASSKATQLSPEDATVDKEYYQTINYAKPYTRRRLFQCTMIKRIRYRGK